MGSLLRKEATEQKYVSRFKILLNSKQKVIFQRKILLHLKFTFFFFFLHLCPSSYLISDGKHICMKSKPFVYLFIYFKPFSVIVRQLK